MTLKGYFTWFKENWQKSGVIVCFFLTIYLVVIVLPESTILFALLMSTPLYMLHEIDEYIFPGGFAQFLNKNIYKTDLENGLLDTTAVFWINMVVWIALPFYSLWAVTDLSQAAWMPYFFIFQAFVHLILGIVGTVYQSGHGFCLVGTCTVGDLDNLAVGSSRSNYQPVLEC
jgi:hypothetical protein